MQMFETKPIACLAPMDGVTDSAYRRIVRQLNPKVVLYSEFTSINGIEHSELVRNRLKYVREELPYIVQLFGNEPELFTKTVKEFQNTGITGIDINMGCPAKRIVKSNNGGSLMKDRDLACRIVEACCKGTTLPITVKTRLGWSDAEQLIDFVKALVNAGAQAITVHGRTYKQAYKGTADWDPIYRLKDALDVPVIGNGDIKSKEEAEERIKNLDGYMIGRASVGNPWVFLAYPGEEAVSLKDKIQVMMQHFQWVREYKEERSCLIEFRKHITGYINGFEGAKACRSLLMKSQSEIEFRRMAESFA